jgi:transposase
MESTGSYWQNLYVELARHGFDVTLCNGKFTKNIKGKKTDVKMQDGYKNCTVLVY